jgi:hypothetical protein
MIKSYYPSPVAKAMLCLHSFTSFGRPLSAVLLIVLFYGTSFSQVLNLGHTSKIENGFGGNLPILKSPNSAYVSGNFLYVTSKTGNALEIIDITIPTLPSVVGNLQDGTGGAELNQPYSVFVSGNYAYVTSLGSNGSLEIVDVTNPTAPVHKGRVVDGGAVAPFLDYPQAIYVSGNYAYIVNANGLEIIDVSNPDAPVHKGSITDGGGVAPFLNAASSVFVSGNYAYVASFTSNALEVIDVSNPAAPAHAGSLLDGGGAAPYLKGANYVVVSGNLAFVASYSSAALQIIDVSNPVAPTHKGSLINGSGGAVLDGAFSVIVSGSHAYIVNQSGLEVVDISDPSTPIHKGSIADGDGGALLNGPQYHAVAGNYVYIPSAASNAVEIVDVSNPNTPSHSNSILDGGGGAQIGSSRWVHVAGNYCYIVSQDLGTLEIVDISNPASPIHKGSIADGSGGAPYLSGAYGVFVSGKYAYVASYYSFALEIIDITNPAGPIHVGALQNGSGGAVLVKPYSVVVKGNYAYIAGGNTLEIVNIANPAAPTHVSSLTGGFIAGARCIEIAGNYAYIVGTGGLEIIDITNPAVPLHWGILADGGGSAPFLFNPRSIFISGNYAYITALGRKALEIVDITNPAAPVHRGSILNGTGGALLDAPEVVKVSGNYAFVTDANSNAVEVVNVSNPAAPVHYNRLLNGEEGALLQQADGLALYNNHAYITGLGGGLEIAYFYSPQIASFTPKSGAPGSMVTITGQNFKESMTVAFNGTPVITHGAVTATSAVVTIPEGAAIGPLTLTVDGQKTTSTANFILTPLALTPKDIEQTSFTATWSDVGATSYFLDVSTDNFATFVSGYNDLPLSGTTSQRVTGLNPATSYQYRLRSSDGLLISDNSNSVTINTIPETPTAQEATLVGQTTFTANWTAVTGATDYFIDVASDESFTKFLVGYNNLNISVASDRSQIVNGLIAYTKYYYRIRSADTTGSSPSSNVIAVTTLDISAPLISNPLAPNPTTLTAGASPVFNSIITDNVSVDSVQVFYRGISKPVFKKVSMQGPGGLGGNYSITVQPDWYDSLGMEYYFAARDKAGNKAVGPRSFIQLITPSITLPALPSGSSQSDYRIIAFPYQLTDNKVTSVYNNVPWSDNTKAGLWWWNPNLNSGAGDYDQYGASTTLQTIDPGKGYWAITSSPVSPTLSNVPAPKYNQSNLYTMTLKPNWNEVGNPYPVSISWDDVIAYNQANNPGALFGPLTVYDGNGYKVASGDNLLPAFEGGFVKSLSSSDITILIPFPGQTNTAERIASIHSDISEQDWNVFLHISQNERTNQLGGFGMHRLAQSGIDRFDNFNPPGFLNIPEVNFINTDFPTVSFSNDMVQSQEDYTWTFIPEGKKGSTARLTWNAELNTNSSKQLFLLDEEQLSVTDMSGINQYDFVLTTSSRFRIFYGTNVRITSSRVVASSPFPNPLIGDGKTTINLALPESGSDYSINLLVYNAQGGVIGSANKRLAPGIHPLEFTLPASLGEGIYIYRLAIANEKISSIHTGKIVKP